jgi:DNA-binding SARP family transcriptional activator
MPAGGGELEFRVLGALELSGRAGPVLLAGKHRALLAALVLHPNEPCRASA